MPIITIDGRPRLEKFLRHHPYLHLYALGDLDDLLWPHTSWYGYTHEGILRAVCLVYKALDPPVLLALAAPENQASLHTLVAGIRQNLPRTIYAHLNLGLNPIFESDWVVEPHGLHLKMGLESLQDDPIHQEYITETITRDNTDEIFELFQVSHPINDFDPGMLAIGPYLGIRRIGRLISLGGVHVYSPIYRVAALGNIVTHPDFRGQGMASAITVSLCRHLSQNIDLIGLNVKADNVAAIHIYQRCGFRPIARYNEVLLTKK